MKKVRNILLAIICIQLKVYSQLLPANANTGLEISRMQFQAKQVIAPSPEAANLGKYGNVPVSLFTGTPSVSIPMVELKGNVLSLPVSLSYNNSGFKPEEVAPWTGLGWALNAGGVITRSVMGDPDMDDNYFKSPSPLGTVPTDEYQKQLYYESVRSRQIETQPDVYYFNFMGQSGKFLLNPDGSMVKKEKTLLHIVRSMGAASEWIFIIYDEQGFRYEFMELEKTTTTPVDDEPGAPTMTVRTFTSSWYLSKIVAPYGEEEIDFEYYSPTNPQSLMSQALTNNSVTYTMTEYISRDGDPLGSYWQNMPPTNSMYTFHHPASAIYKKFIKKATLKKNNISIGYIDFESDENVRDDLGDADFDGERRLKKIKLYDITNSVSKLVNEFALGYGNFGAGQVESPGYYRRLKLKSVQEISRDTITTPSKPPYIFYYNGENDNMPGRYTSGLDHWGIYNGQSNLFGSSPTLIPTVNVTGIEHINGNRGLGANREPDATNAALTVLNKITYPTGGYTSFEYEGNSGSMYGSVNPAIPVGGLRIKQMIDHSFTDKPAVVKRYEYKKEDGNSSGKIVYYPYYYTTSTWEDDSFCPFLPGQTAQAIKTYNATISAGSTFGLGSIQGGHIGYTRVTEYQTDLVTNRSLGKTMYTYDIQGSNEIDNHIGNGELLKKEVYDNGDKLLEEVSNTFIYEDFLGERIISRNLLSLSEQSNRTRLMSKTTGGVTSYIYIAHPFCGTVPTGYGALLIVPTQSYHLEKQVLPQRKKLDQQVTKWYDPLSHTYMTHTKKYTYGNPAHNYPTLIEETDSKKDKVFTAIKYAADYVLACPSGMDPGSMAAAINDMRGLNIYSIPVEKLQYRENPGGINRRYISGEVTQYKYGLPEKIYYLQANPMPATVTASEASCSAGTQSIDNHYRLVATLTYDAQMNLKEEKKTDDVVTTYLWGYNNRYPVAKIIGKTHTEALSSGINQAVLNNPTTENALRTELNKLYVLTDAMVTTHTYQPMVGALSAMDAREQLLRYEYDALNRLVNVKDGNEIVQNYRYNYGLGTAPTTSATSLFYNAPAQNTYTKTGCPVGQYGEAVIYAVPYGKHAAVTQVQADALAAADIAANGQNYANAVGKCYWQNTARNPFVLKNNCLPEEGPAVGIRYLVPAGKYKSFISQADADAQAIADVATLGQVYANTYGSCSCTGEGKKWINGVCETGTMTMAGGLYNNGQWECVYYYVFSDNSTSGNYYITQPFPCPSGN